MSIYNRVLNIRNDRVKGLKFGFQCGNLKTILKSCKTIE
jgi:hypothetical protein